MSSLERTHMYSCLLTDSIAYEGRGEGKRELVRVCGRGRNGRRKNLVQTVKTRRERERGRKRDREMIEREL